LELFSFPCPRFYLIEWSDGTKLMLFLWERSQCLSIGNSVFYDLHFITQFLFIYSDINCLWMPIFVLLSATLELCICICQWSPVDEMVSHTFERQKAGVYVRVSGKNFPKLMAYIKKSNSRNFRNYFLTGECDLKATWPHGVDRQF